MAARGTERLSSIDALRAIAALAVATYHAVNGGPPIHAPHDAGFVARLPLSFGFAGVYLFFVLSGFCIHQRWVRARVDGVEPSADFAAFWKRRLLRLYPAYAVALALGIAFAVHDGSAARPGFAWNVVSHVLLVHNVRLASLYGINAVFWTLAVEEQMYLLYFVLLWLRRRCAWPTILAIVVGVRVAWIVIALAAARVGVDFVIAGSVQATWCLWVLGAVAVEAYHGVIRLPAWTRSWSLAAGLALATAAINLLDRAHDSLGWAYLLDVFVEQLGWGLAAFIALNALLGHERALHARRRSIVVAPLLWIGVTSYSLYLFHMYVIDGLGLWGISGVALAVVAGGVGYVCFERPFLARRR